MNELIHVATDATAAGTDSDAVAVVVVDPPAKYTAIWLLSCIYPTTAEGTATWAGGLS